MLVDRCTVWKDRQIVQLILLSRATLCSTAYVKMMTKPSMRKQCTALPPNLTHLNVDFHITIAFSVTAHIFDELQ